MSLFSTVSDLPVASREKDSELAAVCSHYIEKMSNTEDLVWIEVYRSDRVADIPLTQWLALTPADLVA